jgi:hypothetical protein
MKNIKGILYTAVIGLILVTQLLHPASVFADGDGTGTPMPTSTPEVTATPQPTETVIETALPSGTPENTVTPEETTSPTDVPAVTLTPGPNEPTAEPVAATPIATEFATPSADVPTVEPVVTTPAPTEVPTEEEDETKAAPTDASTPTAEPVVSEDNSIVEEPSLGEMLSEIPSETEVIILDESGQPEPLATVEAAEAVSSGDPIWCPAGQAPTPGVNGCTSSYATLGDLVANAGGGINTNGTIWITSGSVGDTNPVIIDGSLYTNWANYSLTLQGGWSGISGDTTIGPNSEFTVPVSINNWNNGLAIQNIDASSINLTNVISNQGNGVIIKNTYSDINMENIDIENTIGTSGLFISTVGSIQGTNITSNNNSALGLNIDSGGFVTLNNVTASNNGDSGLIINSSKFATLNNITASNNAGEGANIFATQIELTGINEFSMNDRTGLDALAMGVFLSNINANENGLNGAFISSTYLGLSGTNVFNNNGNVGLYLDGNTTAGNPLNVSASGNQIGVYLSNVRDITFKEVEITNNGIGLYIYCGSTDSNIHFSTPQPNITGNTTDIFIHPDCHIPNPFPTPTPIIIRAEGKFTLDCSKQAAYPVQLPNGDLVNIFCPVSGTASIYRLDNTGLPTNLPEGYTYASAFTLDIDQQGKPIPWITEGGYVKSSFVAQPLLPGNTYTVLYWDPWINENGNLVNNMAGGSWVPLKDFLLDGNGNVESFDLFPGTDDPRKIISGVNLVSESNVDRVEVSTNFPGIFVLAQH